MKGEEYSVLRGKQNKSCAVSCCSSSSGGGALVQWTDRGLGNLSKLQLYAPQGFRGLEDTDIESAMNKQVGAAPDCEATALGQTLRRWCHRLTETSQPQTLRTIDSNPLRHTTTAMHDMSTLERPAVCGVSIRSTNGAPS